MRAGASIPGATVTATDTATGISQTTTTNGQGFYSFQSLALGTYVVTVEQRGFKEYQQTNLVLDVNEARTVDATLQVGQVSEKIEVAANALHVETVSSQMGEVIEGKEMTAVPLVSRSYTDLLALQPGVISTTSGLSGAYGRFLHLCRFRRTTGFRRSQLRRIFGKRHARICQWVHPEWHSGSGSGLLGCGRHS